MDLKKRKRNRYTSLFWGVILPNRAYRVNLMVLEGVIIEKANYQVRRIEKKEKKL
ncbi:unnamed protein product [Meloidogyne enterolobii]|uniref:Uncharacterized protein n=1 Tax=Meloidogyne enterolobii TaxID=390850 RepID=A0ACB0ZEM2_MELEN